MAENGVQGGEVPAETVPQKNAAEFLGWKATAILAIVGVGAFNLAFSFENSGMFIVLYLFCAVALVRVKNTRVAFYLGLTMGLLSYGPQLYFFRSIFGNAAVGLWLMLGLWMAGFLLVGRVVAGWRGGIWLIPFLWTGWEYLRCELNPLRFTWLFPSSAFAAIADRLPLHLLGVYGTTFVALCVIVLILQVGGRSGLAIKAGVILLLSSALWLLPPAEDRPAASPGPMVVAIQLEMGSDTEVLDSLDRAVAEYPQADIYVMGEYTFGAEIPPTVRAWCAKQKKYFIAGGAVSLDEPGRFENTAFVVNPEGKIEFTQVKSVPIQFFADGIPARSQKVWNSPWGKIGVCICYDLSYVRVADEMIRQGAQAIICPIMDKIAWTQQEHVLHARVGPCRAREYGVPVLRACTSGISQLISSSGRVVESAPFPGQGRMIAGRLPMGNHGFLPWDRMLVNLCVAVFTLVVAIGIGSHFRQWVRRCRERKPPVAAG